MMARVSLDVCDTIANHVSRVTFHGGYALNCKQRSSIVTLVLRRAAYSRLTNARAC
jgi:hypothetical protein